MDNQQSPTCCTENYIQYPVIKPYWKSIWTNVCVCIYMYIYICVYIYICIIITLLYSRNWHNTVNQLYVVKVLVTQSCLTLCDPIYCSPPGFSVHGILQARLLEWVAISFSRGSSWPFSRAWVSCIAVNNRAWQPTPAFLPGESLGQSSLVGYSP